MVKRDKNDILVSKIVRKRDFYSCVRCGKTYKSNDLGLHCSHFQGRRMKSTRHDLDNLDSLCMGCHKYWETEDRQGYTDFKIKQLGIKKYNQLIQRSREVFQYPKHIEEVYSRLKDLAYIYGVEV
jgi:5-methylcytosine-specific restriction endonuclease McrA